MGGLYELSKAGESRVYVTNDYSVVQERLESGSSDWMHFRSKSNRIRGLDFGTWRVPKALFYRTKRATTTVNTDKALHAAFEEDTKQAL